MTSTRYEELVFYARHYELLTWLWDQWGKDLKVPSDLEEAIRKAGISKGNAKRILALLKGGQLKRLREIIEKADDQAKNLVDTATNRLREVLLSPGYQFGKPRKLRKNSREWCTDFSVGPKQANRLRAGVELHNPSTNNRKDKQPCLIAYFSFPSSGKKAVAFVRGDRRLGSKVCTHKILDKSIEETSPDVIYFGASVILGHADDEFNLDVDALIEECVSPAPGLRKQVKKLYEAACI